jgi:leucyl-tRNA synthetase
MDRQEYTNTTCCGLQVLYDLGMVSHKEPFQRLVSQGMILGELEYVAMQQSDGSYSQDSQGQGTPVRFVQQLCKSVRCECM